MPNFIKRPRLRFSLAMLLLVVTAVCVGLGRITYLAKAQRDAVRVITEAEGIAIYDFQRNPAGTSPPPNGPPAPQWLVDAIGPEYFQTVVVMDFATNNGRRRNSKAPKVTDEVLSSLASLPEIEVLELSHNGTVTDESLMYLGRIPALKTLYLFRTNVQGLGLAHLEHLTQLENLTLDCSPVNDAGLQHLGRLRSLKHLNLNHTSITGADIAHLENLHQLAHLGLNYTAITDQGLKHLERVKSLTSLEVIGTNVTPEGVDPTT